MKRKDITIGMRVQVLSRGLFSQKVGTIVDSPHNDLPKEFVVQFDEPVVEDRYYPDGRSHTWNSCLCTPRSVRSI